MSRSAAHDNYDRFNKLLEATLLKKKLPAREPGSVEEFQKMTEGLDEILLDGTENSTERPQNADLHEEMYSGKKHGHTDVSLVISDKKRYIY